MAFAESSQSELFVCQGTLDTPAGTYETIEPTSHSVSVGSGSFTSAQIRADRKPVDTVRTDTRGEGNITLEMQTDVIDPFLRVALLDLAYSTATNYTATVTFGTPDAAGIQTVSEDTPSVNPFQDLTAGDWVKISGTVADAGNVGVFRVVTRTDNNNITIYNPGGAPETDDADVDFDNLGSITIGSEAPLLFAERVFRNNDTNIIYSEFFENQRIGNMNMSFQASQASTLSCDLLGDVPSIQHQDGQAPGTLGALRTDAGPNAASLNRIMHGMEDMKEIILYSTGFAAGGGSASSVNLCNVATQLTLALNNNLRQDFALCSAAAQNTSAQTASLTGNITAFVDNADLQSTRMVDLLLNNPTAGAQLHFNFDDGTTGYGVFVDTVRFQSAPVPITGNDQPTTINAAYSGLDLRITKYAV